MKVNNTDIYIVRGDITEIAVDAIISPVNEELVMYEGLAKVLQEKGGESISEEAHKKSPIEVGEAVETTAGELRFRYILHAAIHAMDKKSEEKDIRSACKNALKLASGLGLQSVVLPALGCGVGGFHAQGSAKIIAQEILEHCRRTKTSLTKIMICLCDALTFDVFEQTVFGYISHIKDDLGNGPYVTVDIIIEMEDGLVVIERSNPPYGFALPGGFLDYGESLEEAAEREAKEETNLELKDLKQFHTYSAPGRDPRFQTVSTVFTAKGIGEPHSGDDAKALKVVPWDELKMMDFAFDHKEIILEYLRTTSSKKN
jgi:O-acetyl-ADP-ribose deacetylase (regulator of RNase III)/ADP-ribose pyrophosphatase YjhB (NUDIX family)